MKMVLTTDPFTPAVNGVVIQGINGRQHAEKDDLAICVEQFLKHPEGREQMGRSVWISGQRFSVLECLHAHCWKARGSA